MYNKYNVYRQCGSIRRHRPVYSINDGSITSDCYLIAIMHKHSNIINLFIDNGIVMPVECAENVIAQQLNDVLYRVHKLQHLPLSSRMITWCIKYDNIPVLKWLMDNGVAMTVDHVTECQRANNMCTRIFGNVIPSVYQAEYNTEMMNTIRSIDGVYVAPIIEHNQSVINDLVNHDVKPSWMCIQCAVSNNMPRLLMTFNAKHWITFNQELLDVILKHDNPKIFRWFRAHNAILAGRILTLDRTDINKCKNEMMWGVMANRQEINQLLDGINGNNKLMIGTLGIASIFIMMLALVVVMI